LSPASQGTRHAVQDVWRAGRQGGATGTPLQPAVCTGAKRTRIEGEPALALVSTSHVERQNLTMRMRRFTGLTKAFSKKFETHVHMVALYTVWYNFIRIHRTLKMSPAMAAGVSQTLWSMSDLCDKMDAVAPKPGKRWPCKTKAVA